MDGEAADEAMGDDGSEGDSFLHHWPICLYAVRGRPRLTASTAFARCSTDATPV